MQEATVLLLLQSTKAVQDRQSFKNSSWRHPPIEPNLDRVSFNRVSCLHEMIRPFRWLITPNNRKPSWPTTPPVSHLPGPDYVLDGPGLRCECSSASRYLRFRLAKKTHLISETNIPRRAWSGIGFSFSFSIRLHFRTFSFTHQIDVFPGSCGRQPHGTAPKLRSWSMLRSRQTAFPDLSFFSHLSTSVLYQFQPAVSFPASRADAVSIAPGRSFCCAGFWAIPSRRPLYLCLVCESNESIVSGTRGDGGYVPPYLGVSIIYGKLLVERLLLST